ncbi:MAG: hypothetical protein WCL37_05705, partial [Chrysiogenales bacterium]
MKIVKTSQIRSNQHGAIVIPLFRGLSLAAIGEEFPELEKILQRKKTLIENGEALFCHSLSTQRLFLLVTAGRGNRSKDARQLACRIMLQLREKRISR